MPTNENLVPTNLPYGSRGEVRNGMRRANLPLQQTAPSSPQGVSPPTAGSLPSSRSPAVGPLGLLLSNGPEAFPFLGDTPPSTAERPNEPASFTAALAASAQSSFARAVSARLSQIL